MMRALVIVGFAFLACAAVCLAQSSSGSSSSGASASGSGSTSSNSGGAPQDSVKPASGSHGASGSQDSGKPTDPAAGANSKKKPKKVWTNDEIATAKSGTSGASDHSSNGSSFARPDASSSSSYTPPTNYEVLVRKYREKLDPLRSDLADLDRKIQAAKEAKGNAREDTAAWIAVQERKRQDILANMGRIQDEAQHEGVSPGDLRD